MNTHLTVHSPTRFSVAWMEGDANFVEVLMQLSKARIAAWTCAVMFPFAMSACGGSATNVGPSLPSQAAAAANTHASVWAASKKASRSGRESGAYEVLYNFRGSYGLHVRDGGFPWAGSLIDVNGTLYGTTTLGGKHSAGTVFTVTPSGTEQVLYSFKGPPQGVQPYAGLIDVNGTLYGTTLFGGAHGNGTVFMITTNPTKERTLHSFKGSPDGFSPEAGLTDVNGTLYGTTIAGGANGFGTVFTITPSGGYSVLYSFKGVNDGVSPYAGLIDVNGTLYGTTTAGGQYGGGTVFTIDPTAGTEEVIHSFGHQSNGTPPDGYDPYAGLVESNGLLYGTTSGGGIGRNGTVFVITPSGAETVIYSFPGAPNGVMPYGGVIVVNGALYGTTLYGGSANYGTLFKVSISDGSETVLHSFTGSPSDGDDPYAGLLDLNGTLYGTTYYGGSGNGGLGTVFAFSL